MQHSLRNALERSRKLLALFSLVVLVGCVTDPDAQTPQPSTSGGVCPEYTHRDARGQPCNAAGEIRQCWPGDAFCACDTDGDCYAQRGYVACTPPSPDAGVVDDVSERRDVASPQPPPPLPALPALPSPSATPTAAQTSDHPVYRGVFEAGSGRRVATLTVMGERREVVVYVPANRSTPSPLVVLFHGTNGSGPQMLDESGAKALADAQGVVVIAPTARRMSQGDWDHTTEDTYWETWPNTDIHTNRDVVLTRAIVAEAQRVYATDPHRVYFMGHSNGGFFAQMAATLLRDRTAGFAASSAGIVPCATTQSCHFEGNADSCGALRGREGWCACDDTVKSIALPTSGYMPGAYLTHGTNDSTVSVQYTCTLEAGLHALNTPVTTVLRLGDGHVMPATFVRDAWSVIGAYAH